MSEYYDNTGYPTTRSSGLSSSMRAEFLKIEAGFDKLPVLSGNANKAVVVNGSGTGLTVTTGTLSLSGAFTKAGTDSLTLTTTGTTNVTLPTTGTLATLAGAEVLTNKTLSNPIFSGVANGTYTFGGTPTFPASATLTTPQITAPVLSGTVTGTYVLGGTPTIAAPTITGTLTLSGGQIAFPSTQIPSANVNTLDDYEEGNWTPSVGGSATYTIQLGRYVKIGKFVFITGRLVINVIGTGNTTTISGLPFTSSADTITTAITVTSTGSLTASVVSIAAGISPSTSAVVLYSRTAAATSDSAVAVIGSGTEVNFSGWYEATQ